MAILLHFFNKKITSGENFKVYVYYSSDDSKFSIGKNGLSIWTFLYQEKYFLRVGKVKILQLTCHVITKTIMNNEIKMNICSFARRNMETPNEDWTFIN